MPIDLALRRRIETKPVGDPLLLWDAIGGVDLQETISKPTWREGSDWGLVSVV